MTKQPSTTTTNNQQKQSKPQPIKKQPYFSREKRLQSSTILSPFSIQPITSSQNTSNNKPPFILQINQIPLTSPPQLQHNFGSLNSSLQELQKYLMSSSNQNNDKKVVFNLQLPYQEKQEKQLGYSRLLIIPKSETRGQVKEEGSSRHKKEVGLMKNEGNDCNDDNSNNLNHNNRIQSLQPRCSSSSPTKKQPTSLTPSLSLSPTPSLATLQLLQLKQNEQRSLLLLFKSFSLPSQPAILLLRKSLQQADNNISSAEYLSFLYLQLSRPLEALHTCNKILDKYIVHDPQITLKLQINKSAALNHLGRYSQSIKLLQKCIKIKQNDYSINKNLADAYFLSGNYEKAVWYYQTTIKLKSDHDQAYYNLAVCMYIMNNFHNAKIIIDKAIELNSKNCQYLELKRQIQAKLAVIK